MRIWSSLARLLLLSIVSVSFYGTHGQQVTRVTYQSGTTISVCDGWETVYTCPLNGSVNSNDVQWYRRNRTTSTRVSIDQNGQNTYFSTEDGNTVLTIVNTLRAYDGYLWVEASSQTFCYTSITVLARPSSLNVTTTKNIKSSSIVLQWDAVDDSLTTSYTIIWSTRAGGGLQVATLTEQTSYTINGLSLDTVYTIAVTAANECGSGPEFRTSISLSAVISEPNNVTVCEGGEAVFTCLLSSSIRSDDVQWYRSLVDMSSSELVEGENINFLNHTTGGALNASLIITNVSKSFAGNFWVRIPSGMVCRASLTILPKPSASLRVNITNNNESLSSVLQWNPVDASPANNYTVTWTNGTDLTQSVATTMETSYTITGLALDTVYTITVAAANMCGSGPEFSTTVSFSTVIDEPDDVTVCEGREVVLTCVLNSNIRSDDVQWYRLIKDTGATEMVDPDGANINFVTDTIGNATRSSLTISNVIKSYTGYFWVVTPSLNVCNASLIVLPSPSALSVNVMKNSKLSVDVQWDAVNDSLTTVYTLTWTRAGGGLQVATVTEQTSYTITGLTLDTVYTITVSAANTCGSGPGYSTSVSFPAVISEPDDVTVCEGKEAMFTCVLNSNIRSDDVQWYRFIKDTSTTEIVDPVGANINFVTDTIGNATNSSLTITNVIKSYTGYFWVGIPSLNVCNASLTVLTSPSNLIINVTEDIDSLSVVIQWEAVINLLNTTYMVSWNNGNNPVESAPLTEQTSYIITGLTLDTVYAITVTAANECGTGPEFSTSIILSADIPPTSSSNSSAIASPVTTTDLVATTIAVVNASSTIATTTTMIISTSFSIDTITSSSTGITTIAVSNSIVPSISAGVSNSSMPFGTAVVPSTFLSPVANSTTRPTFTSTSTSIAIITTTTDAVTTTVTTTSDASTTTTTVDPTTSTSSLTSIDITTTTTTTAATATAVATTTIGAIPTIIATTSQGGVVSLGGINSSPGEILSTAVATTSIGVSPAPTTENSSSSEVASDDGGIGIEIIAGAAAAGGIALLLLIIIVICCGIYIKKKGKRKHRIHRHNTFLSDTSEIPGTLSAYGEEKDKPGIGTFHPPEEDAASIKSDVMNEENQNSEPLSPPNEEPESLHPPDTYDRLPKPPNGQSEVQPFNGYSEADTYDRLRKPVSGYTELILNQSSDPPDIYDKLVPQKVADPPKSTSDGMQYMNLPNKSNDSRTGGDGGHTENNPSVNNASCDPPKSANNGDVQYLNVTNVMALNGGADNDNRASDNQQEITYANLQPLPPSTNRYLPKNNADLLEYISTDL